MSSTTGAVLLLRQDLRRDRIIVPAWLASLTLMAFASARATESLFAQVEDRITIAAALNEQPGLVALYGPILDPRSAGELAMSKLTVLYALFSAVLYVVLVRRHTRVEEESGRAELVGGTRIGRDAPLLAAVGEAVGVAVTLGLLVTLADVAGGLPVGGSIAFGASWAGTGLVATGIAAVACQLSASARTCGAVAAGLLAGAFVVRAVGDTVDRLHWGSWLSALGWNTQLRAWSEPRWWVIGLYVVLSAGLVWAARTMTTRRDVGAGLLAARAGRESSTISSPWGLTVRLHRSALVLWTVAVATSSLLFGAMAPGFEDLLGTSVGQELIDRLGGAFVAALLPIIAMAVSVFAVTVANRALHDEADGRTPLLLASGASRARWFAATAALAMLGSLWLLAVAGSALWLGYRTAGGAGTPAVVAALGWSPAVGVVLAAALVGLSLRQGWLGWSVLVASVTLSLVGELLELPEGLVRLSPFSALPAYPVVAWTWTPVLVLTVVVALLTATAWGVFSHRDVG